MRLRLDGERYALVSGGEAARLVRSGRAVRLCNPSPLVHRLVHEPAAAWRLRPLVGLGGSCSPADLTARLTYELERGWLVLLRLAEPRPAARPSTSARGTGRGSTDPPRS